MEGNLKDLQSIRPEEQIYEQEIRSTYNDHPHLFVTHSSDLLHLDIADRMEGTHAYKCIVAKSNFKKFDIIAEIRGSIIGYQKLKKLIVDGMVDRCQLPVLLYLNYEQQYLLSPKNITKYLFGYPRAAKANGQLQPRPGNCYIENHFGSKLLTIASRDIQSGEQLILEQQSYSKAVYSYNAAEF